MPRPENDKTLKDIPQGAIILNVLQQRGFDPGKFVPRDYQCRSVMVYRGNNEILDSATAKGAQVVNLSDRLNAQQEPKPALFSILTVHHKNPKVQKELGRIVNLDAHI